MDGTIFLKENVSGIIRRKSFIYRRKSIDFDRNKLERKGSWLNSDEQRHGRNLFGPQMLLRAKMALNHLCYV